jgi:TRAP transporter 4TM/12TM fusion protein
VAGLITPEATAADEAETPARALGGLTGRAANILAAALALYAIYWVVSVVETYRYRASYLLIALVLTFLVYPATARGRGRVSAFDWIAIVVAIASLAWPLIDADFPYRAATPTAVDLILGTATILLVLEATRRTAGWILTAIVAGFILYAYLGPLLDLVGLELFAHRGYDLDRLVGILYMTLDGIFGVPLDVAATYIILFAVFGAVLEVSGAARFFIDFATAITGRARSGAGPGRTVTVAGFLLGSVSGSGVAVTMTLGSCAWPLLRRAGYSPETGAAMLAAGGIGAIMAPPTMGAAAFLIAEFLGISYFDVLVMAVIPAVLYYLSVFLMIEADARRLDTRPVAVEAPSVLTLTRRYGYYFLSLISIPALMLTGMTAFRAVLWATLIAVASSWLRRETALGPRGLLRALAAGGRSVLPVIASTAAAGIIVGVVTLTGLGLKLSGIIVDLAAGNILLTVLFAAVAVLILGLAVPVTASYIIAAVMIAPALTEVGIPAVAAHMFIFYYAVLSEVSPPTALSPIAAAAMTGGQPVRTMMLTWKYTLPAFLVPFVFTLSPEGLGLLLRAPFIETARTALTAAVGVGALAGAFGGWLWKAASIPERVGATVAGLLLCYADPRADIAGLAVLMLTVGLHVVRVRARAGGEAVAAD